MIDAAIVVTEAGWTQMTPHNPISEEIASLLDDVSVTCRQWAEQDLGPYYLAGQPVRRDVTEDRPGVPLGVGLLLAEDDGSPVPEAALGIWHCDAAGRYSGFPPPTPSAPAPSRTRPPQYAHERVSCEAAKPPTPPESRSFVPSTRGGIQGGPSIST